MCYIKMFYLQMKQVKKEIIRNSRSMTMPNLYVDHEKSKLKICSLINKNVLCRLCRGHVLNILPCRKCMICYVFYVLNKPDVHWTEFAHSYIPKGNIVFIYTYKCVDGRYILQQAKTLSYCLSLAINVKKSNNTRGSYWKSDI